MPRRKWSEISRPKPLTLGQRIWRRVYGSTRRAIREVFYRIRYLSFRWKQGFWPLETDHLPEKTARFLIPRLTFLMQNTHVLPSELLFSLHVQENDIPEGAHPDDVWDNIDLLQDSEARALKERAVGEWYRILRTILYAFELQLRHGHEVMTADMLRAQQEGLRLYAKWFGHIYT